MPRPCPEQVPNDVLKQWVVLRARMQQGQGAPFLYEGTGQEFYMLRCAAVLCAAVLCCVLLRSRAGAAAGPTGGSVQLSCPRSPSAACSKRVKQHATPPEIDAVRKACRNLLSADEKGAAAGAGWRHCRCAAGLVGLAPSSPPRPAPPALGIADTHRQLVHQTAALLGKYVVHLRKRAAGGGVGGADGGVIEIVPVENGPVVERVCFNRHPQCEAWVKKVRAAAGRGMLLPGRVAHRHAARRQQRSWLGSRKP